MMLNNYHTLEKKSFDETTGTVEYPWYRVKEHFTREILAEGTGMFITMAFLNGVVSQVVLGGATHGDYSHINLGVGLAFMMGIHTCGGISGAHLNPAVTIALAVHGRFEWKKVPLYIVAQLIGAFLGAAVVFAIYYPSFNEFDAGRSIAKSAGIFATYPIDLYAQNLFSAFLCEFFGTALLVFAIFSLDDPTNMPTNPIMKPLTVALVLVMIGMSFGLPTGYALNPARDLGPRIFTAVAGWGVGVFTAANYYFLIPIFAPIVGAIAGGGAYMVTIYNHHDQHDDLKALKVLGESRGYQAQSTIYVYGWWIAPAVLLTLYLVRVYYLNAFHIITYGLGIYLLNLFIGFLSPQINPDTEGGPVLPSTNSEEFCPFSRSFSRSLSSVFWPILLMYFILLFTLTMKRQIKHMCKHNYIRAVVQWQASAQGLQVETEQPRYEAVASPSPPSTVQMEVLST
ncbi:hypothetical protein DYB35_001675 [Aphanomyces astaci]|uniref:Aquaporin n=1 Tax=Aphanomyces astaci TaxID=112090 RepID=A0A397CJJ7_APHAT|nr:hypothetical protein DYB38_005749 [Aphanomyces astaci]RHY87673.1 hypothetical protein DYB35_001675 [Aphanomyces astaci]